MRIILIRHGETIGHTENRYDGVYDDNLSKKGIEQSIDLAHRLKNKNIDVIFSSPLIRAKETSQIISNHKKCEIIINDSLKARDQFGILTGMIKDDAKLIYPDLVKLVEDRHNTIMGAESYADFSKRIIDYFYKLINENDYESVAVVAHGGILKILFREFLELGEISKTEDCAFVELEKRGDKFLWIEHSGFEPKFKIPDSI